MHHLAGLALLKLLDGLDRFGGFSGAADGHQRPPVGGVGAAGYKTNSEAGTPWRCWSGLKQAAAARR
jgi:hypothetical protein